jgi:hypothetical protein
VGHKYDGLLKPLLQVQKFTLQFGSGNGIERAERLVHQKNWGIGSQGARYAHSLPLAAGKLARITRADLGIESNEFQELLHAFCDSLRRPVLDLRNQTDIALDGEVGEQAHVLDDVAGAASKPDYVPIACWTRIYAEFATAGSEQVIDQFERSGFTGAAAAQQYESLSALNFEGQIVKQFAATVTVEAIRDIAKLDRWAGVGRIAHRVFW